MKRLAKSQSKAVEKAYFLGGADLEMETIRNLLRRHSPGRFFDKRLAWGARASRYRHEIEEELQAGRTPVLIELEDDLDLPRDRVLLVDHHGSLTDRPTSLRQVFDLLDLPEADWTRFFQLVAANDRGSISAMREMGATPEEMKRIRDRDRAAQGVKPEQELEARRAVNGAERLADGWLTLVRCPHARTAPVADFLDPLYGGPGYRNLMIVSPQEINVFAEGEVIERLRDRFPNSWAGGDLPRRGFWGVSGPHVGKLEEAVVRQIVDDSLGSEPPASTEVRRNSPQHPRSTGEG